VAASTKHSQAHKEERRIEEGNETGKDIIGTALGTGKSGVPAACTPEPQLSGKNPVESQERSKSLKGPTGN